MIVPTNLKYVQLYSSSSSIGQLQDFTSEIIKAKNKNKITEQNWTSLDIRVFTDMNFKKFIINNKKGIESEGWLMRILEIRLFFDGLFHYFSQFQAVNLIGERSPYNKQKWNECQQEGIFLSLLEKSKEKHTDHPSWDPAGRLSAAYSLCWTSRLHASPRSTSHPCFLLATKRHFAKLVSNVNYNA